MFLKRISWILPLLAVVAGCQPSFGPQTLVERLRILAIRARPPEIGLADRQVQLEALVADAGGRARHLDCTWAVCLVEIGWAAGAIDCPGGDSLVFSHDCDGASLDVAELLEWLAERGFDEQALEQLPPGVGEDMVPLYVGLEVVQDQAVERGIKRLRLNLEQDEPNENPVLLGVEVLEGPDDGGLPLGSQLRLRPRVDEDSRQTFPDPEDGQPRREDFLFSWFSTSGEFSERRTILDVDSRGRPLDENTWTLTPEYSVPGPAWLWVVVRDGRWGCDWVEVNFQVEEASLAGD